MTKRSPPIGPRDVYAIAKFMEENQHVLDDLLAEERSNLINKTFSLNITVHQVRRLESELGYAFNARKMTGTMSGDRTPILAAALCHLYDKLGEPIPDYLRMLRSRRAGAEVAAAYSEYLTGKGG